MKLNYLIYVLVLVVASVSAARADILYTGAYTVGVIDNLQNQNTAFITLNGYENTVCDENRILIETTSSEEFKKMLAIVLGAFHTSAKVNFLIDTSSNCRARDRVLLSK